MELLLARLFDGVANGTLYASVALSLVLIYKATALINFAQGEMAMVGAFLTYVLAVELNLNILVALVIAMVASALFGVVVHRTIISRFDEHEHLPVVLVTLGLLLALNAFVAILFGYDTRRLPSLLPQGSAVQIGSANLRWYTLGVLVVSVGVLALLTILLRRTNIGLAFRAVATNTESARLVGIPVSRVITLSWAIAAAIGTLAATLYVSDPLRQLDPLVMERVLIFAAAAAVLGGLDSLWGSLAGGLLLGLSESLVTGYVSWIPPELGMVVALICLALVLLWRPSGLFGSVQVARV